MALVSTRLTMDAIEILQIMVANIICLLTQALDLRHLQFLVLNELKPLVHPRDLKAIEECAWYKCAFGQRAHSGEVCSLDDFNIPTEIHDRFREIYKSVCSGKSSVANSLGKGTKPMYLFVREQLGIPFYHGQAPLDTWMDKILNAIQAREIEEVLMDIFEMETVKTT